MKRIMKIAALPVASLVALIVAIVISVHPAPKPRVVYVHPATVASASASPSASVSPSASASPTAARPIAKPAIGKPIVIKPSHVVPVQFTAGPYTGVRPSSIQFSTDAGNIVIDIKWASWNQTSAVGYGEWQENSCQPHCKAGTSREYPAVITLTHPAKSEPNVWDAMTEVTSGPYGFHASYSYPSNWALGADLTGE